MRVTNHINKSKMKVKELIEALSYYDGDDDIIPNPRFEVREKLDSFTSQFMKSIEVEGDDD